MSEHSRTMSRVPEKMSFTHVEGVRWLADLPDVTGDRDLRRCPGGKSKVVKRPSAWDRA
jgi:hypothetical protein